MRKLLTATGTLLFSALLATAAQNVFTVTDGVLRADPPNFGINFGSAPFKPWSADMYFNCWNEWYSFEPITFRLNGQATGGGKDYLESIKGQPCDPNSPNAKSSGAGHWFLMTDGFWNSADICIWRATKDSIALIRKDKVKLFKSPRRGETGEERYYLEGEGEPIQKGDIYMVHMSRLDVPDAVNNPEVQRTSHFVKMSPGVRWIYDDSTFAPEGGSTASLKLTLPGATEPAGLTHAYLKDNAKEGGAWLNFNKGKKYQCDIWLKQKGLTAAVTVQLGDRITKEFQVGAEWQKFSFEVPNDKPLSDQPGQLLVGSKGAGTLWVDNFAVYQTDVEPFAIMPEWVDALKTYRPGVIRDMGGRGLLSLDGWLSQGFGRRMIYEYDRGVQSGWEQGNISLPQLLDLCEKTGAYPYLMTYILMTDEEIDHLAEYLGAPADIGYGKLRAAHGHPKPWTGTFKKIYVECANEVWNRNFGPQAYAEQPELAGKVASRLFKRLNQSPYNTHSNFSYVCPSRAVPENVLKVTGWTGRSALNCPEANAISAAPSGYIGGWDGATIVGKNDVELLEGNLLFSAQTFEPAMQAFSDLWKALGRNLEMMMYEAGPGYSLPGPGKVMLEEEERIQKSLALGTVTLDNFMFVLANNGNANYFKMKKSPKWATHNQDMVPHNTFLALQLRNLYCKGDLLTVKEEALSTVNSPAKQAVGLNGAGQRVPKQLPAMSNIPLVRLYAFKDGSRRSFIALNRSFKEAQPVTIKVPYSPADSYTVYMLTSPDPRDSNRVEEKLKITEEKKTGFSNEFTFTLPPASCCVIVNNEK